MKKLGKFAMRSTGFFLGFSTLKSVCDKILTICVKNINQKRNGISCSGIAALFAQGSTLLTHECLLFIVAPVNWYSCINLFGGW